jgi:DNA-binding transcriptional ArsR family regulator
VLEQLAEGSSTSEIARRLFVSPQAVTYHIGNLLAKFQSTNRAGLVSRAFVLGILEPIWPPRAAARILDRERDCWHRMKDLQRRRTRRDM